METFTNHKTNSHQIIDNLKVGKVVNINLWTVPYIEKTLYILYYQVTHNRPENR